MINVIPPEAFLQKKVIHTHQNLKLFFVGCLFPIFLFHDNQNPRLLLNLKKFCGLIYIFKFFNNSNNIVCVKNCRTDNEFRGARAYKRGRSF